MNDLNDKCPWPHVVSSPIYVYDWDSYDKYQTGEYQPPKTCICGATLVYPSPPSICLVERGELISEMLVTLEYPLTRLQSDYIEEYAAAAEKREQRVADAYNKNSGPQKGVAGEIEAQRWSEDVDHVKRSMELVMWGKKGETYEEMMERRRAEAPKGMKDRAMEAIDKIRECARAVTPDPDPKEAARLAYYDAEQILRGAFGLELEFGTDEGWPPRKWIPPLKEIEMEEDKKFIDGVTEAVEKVSNEEAALDEDQLAAVREGKYPNVSMGCSMPKVVCPTCKREAPLPDIQAAADACIFCGEDHTYRECPEYSEQWDALKADLDKEDDEKAR